MFIFTLYGQSPYTRIVGGTQPANHTSDHMDAGVIIFFYIIGRNEEDS